MSKQVGDYIELYPGNWLYNAGVVGWLMCFDMEGYLSGKPIYNITNDGKLIVDRRIFEGIKVENYLNSNKVVNLKGSNTYYRNFIDTGGKQEEIFKEFIKALSCADNLEKSICEFCDDGTYVNYKYLYKNKSQDDWSTVEKFYNKISQFSMSHNSFLGPSINEFPNSAWNFGIGVKICHLCTFLIIHHHLAFTKIHDGSEIFINAPSFKLMYELNKLVKEVYSSKEKSKSLRKILGMTLIQYAGRLWSNLGKWSQMNIEVVIRRGDVIDFYSLPYHTVNILSDTKIAILVRSIDESKILDYIISGKYEEILDNVYEEMRKYFTKKTKDNKIFDSVYEENRKHSNKKTKDNGEKFEETFKKLEKKLRLYSVIKEKSHV